MKWSGWDLFLPLKTLRFFFIAVFLYFYHIWRETKLDALLYLKQRERLSYIFSRFFGSISTRSLISFKLVTHGRPVTVSTWNAFKNCIPASLMSFLWSVATTNDSFILCHSIIKKASTIIIVFCHTAQKIYMGLSYF